MTPYRVAIVGTGNIAGGHARALREMGQRVDLVAAMDVERTRVEAFCVEHGIPHPYTDLAALLAAESPNLVHIATPPATHAELAIRCLQAGAGVWCEKPLCGSLAALDRIEAAERASGRYCSSVAQWRFGSAAQHLKRLIREQAMGRLLVGICQTTWYRDLAYYQVPWRGRWQNELGGTTLGHGIHAMDLFLWLCGDWLEIAAMMGTLDRPIEVDDVSMATVRFEDGALGSIVNSVLSPRQHTYLRLDFQGATVEVSGLYGYSNKDWRYSVPENADGAALSRWQDVPADVPSSHTAQLAALLDTMDRGESPPVGTREVRRTIEFITGLYKAATVGQTIRRGSIGPDDPFYRHVAGHPPPGLSM
jgi:predicted dehydrogenase